MSPLGEAFRRAMQRKGEAAARADAAKTAAVPRARRAAAAGPVSGSPRAALEAPASAKGASYGPTVDAGALLAAATRVATFAEGPLAPGCDELTGLRASLLALGLDATPATVLVTGTSCGRATTVLAAGLAGEFARDLAHHVLLLDANVRRPSTAAILELDPELELADVLEGRADVSEAVVYSEGDNLSALVLRPDPLLGRSRVTAEAYLGEAGSETFRRLQESFNYVVIDAGTVEDSAAPRVLAARATGAVLVLPKGVSRESALAARRAITSSGGRLLGAVLAAGGGGAPGRGGAAGRQSVGG